MFRESVVTFFFYLFLLVPVFFMACLPFLRRKTIFYHTTSPFFFLSFACYLIAVEGRELNFREIPLWWYVGATVCLASIFYYIFFPLREFFLSLHKSILQFSLFMVLFLFLSGLWGYFCFAFLHTIAHSI